MLKTLKLIFYTIKETYKKMFCYPRSQIEAKTSSDYDSYWQEKRGASIGSLSSWQKERADFIVRTLKEEELRKISIADIGCGDGSILLYVKKNKNHIERLIGYDNSEFALAEAKRNGIETFKLDISMIADAFSLLDADYYLLLETLEHVQNSESLLEEARRHARLGTFISFPNTGYITHRLRLLFGRFPLQWRIFPNEHIRFWTYRDLMWWLRALSIERYTLYVYKGVPILNHLMPSLFGAGFIVYIPTQPK